MENYDQYFKHAKLITSLYATPKELKTLENVTAPLIKNSVKGKIEEQEKPEPVTVPVPAKKENDNKKKWMKRI